MSLLLALALLAPVSASPAAAEAATASTIRAAAVADASPSARDLRRAATDAEDQGDLRAAYDLAREAYVERPSRSALRQVEALEQLLQATTAVAVR